MFRLNGQIRKAATTLLAVLTISAGATSAVLDGGFVAHGPIVTSHDDVPIHGTPHDHASCLLREASAVLASCPTPPLQEPLVATFAQPAGARAGIVVSFPSPHHSRAPPTS